MGDIVITDISVGPDAVIGQAGDFEGLGATPDAGQIFGVVLSDVDLGSPRSGWKCVNVTGQSTAVSPAPCAQLQG